MLLQASLAGLRQAHTGGTKFLESAMRNRGSQRSDVNLRLTRYS